MKSAKDIWDRIKANERTYIDFCAIYFSELATGLSIDDRDLLQLTFVELGLNVNTTWKYHKDIKCIGDFQLGRSDRSQLVLAYCPDGTVDVLPVSGPISPQTIVVAKIFVSPLFKPFLIFSPYIYDYNTYF